MVMLWSLAVVGHSLLLYIIVADRRFTSPTIYYGSVVTVLWLLWSNYCIWNVGRSVMIFSLPSQGAHITNNTTPLSKRVIDRSYIHAKLQRYHVGYHTLVMNQTYKEKCVRGEEVVKNKRLVLVIYIPLSSRWIRGRVIAHGNEHLTKEVVPTRNASSIKTPTVQTERRPTKRETLCTHQ